MNNIKGLIILFWNLGKKYAKSYADSLIGGSTHGLRWLGAVNYYNDLPTNAEDGDCYTVKYKGTSGFKADGSEYAWGVYNGNPQWIQIGPDLIAENVTYDNTTSGMAATNVQSAVDELNNITYAQSNVRGGSATNALKVGNLPTESLSQRSTFNRNAGTSGYIKIELPELNFMVAFTVRVYSGFKTIDLLISGYNQLNVVGWKNPTARIMSSNDANSVDVVFGYITNNSLFVLIPVGSYTGVSIIDATAGYNAVVKNWADKFNITFYDDISSIETVQTTITAYAPYYRDSDINSRLTTIESQLEDIQTSLLG